MDIRLYTDKDYIPLKDLNAFGTEFVSKTEEYRRSFMEIISLDGLNFVNIVETPTLVKRRFSKNVELKGMLDIKAENHDYILEIAKQIIAGKNIIGISIAEKEKLVMKFKDNNNDLTIVTDYIVKNFDNLLSIPVNENGIEKAIPELSKFDIDFIKNNNDQMLNYSIGDYQKQTLCSYETGRKSLEKLTELNLYAKAKVGKKFVYKPTQKLINIFKGGQ